MTPSSPFFSPLNADRKVRKLLGRSYLLDGRLQEALDIFLGILRENPQDVDALLIIADLYRISGLPAAARNLYLRGLAYQPDHPVIGHKLLLLPNECNFELEDSDPLHSDLLTQLADRLSNLTGQVDREAIGSSANFLIRSVSEDENVEREWSVDETFQLMPVLIELHIRQAQADGRADYIETLQSLRLHMNRWAGAAAQPYLLDDEATESPDQRLGPSEE